MSESSFREEETAKVPDVCLPQLPVRILGRNASYSRARGGRGRQLASGEAAEDLGPTKTFWRYVSYGLGRSGLSENVLVLLFSFFSYSRWAFYMVGRGLDEQNF